MKGADIMNSNLEELLKLSKEVYGRYAFKFELLNDKIKESDRNEMILGAISCGEAPFYCTARQQYSTLSSHPLSI